LNAPHESNSHDITVVASGVMDPAGVVVRDHPIFGRALYASRPFAAAEVVVREQALLISKPQSSGIQSKVERLVSACLAAAKAPSELPAAGAANAGAVSVARWTDACEKVVAFLAAPADIQQAVLHEMDTAVDSSSPLGGLCEALAVVIAQQLPKIVAAAAAEAQSILSAQTSGQQQAEQQQQQTQPTGGDQQLECEGEGLNTFGEQGSSVTHNNQQSDWLWSSQAIRSVLLAFEVNAHATALG
jgi:hypothetical protein